MDELKNNFKKIFVNYCFDIQQNIEERLCSSLVPVVNKKTLSNLTFDKVFRDCCSSGDSMEFDVINCNEMHLILFIVRYFKMDKLH